MATLISAKEAARRGWAFAGIVGALGAMFAASIIGGWGGGTPFTTDLGNRGVSVAPTTTTVTTIGPPSETIVEVPGETVSGFGTDPFVVVGPSGTQPDQPDTVIVNVPEDESTPSTPPTTPPEEDGVVAGVLEELLDGLP